MAPAIIYIKGNTFSEAGRNLAIGTAATFSNSWSCINNGCTYFKGAGLVHRMDAAAERRL